MADDLRMVKLLIFEKATGIPKSKPPQCRRPDKPVGLTCAVTRSRSLTGFPAPPHVLVAKKDMPLLVTESQPLWRRRWQSVLPVSFTCVWCKLPSATVSLAAMPFVDVHEFDVTGSR